MFTVCPKCALPLAVTAADLRVAQGYLRCSRCLSVFNALAWLTEERQSAGPAADAAPPPTPQWTAATGTFSSVLAAEPQPTTGNAAEELLAELDAGAAEDHEHGGIRARLRPLAWLAAAALAVLVLLAQIVNHHRDELAATARFNRPLTALYSALGLHLVPQWDLHAYDVRQLGAAVDPDAAGLITVRASIRNAARQPQPLPLLRVTLQDRFGNRIAWRDVAPRFYLPRATPASSWLPGGQRIDAEMSFVDPGANAVGFELDACLPAGGGVACASDGRAR